jgi:gliding motility-associated protein GldM
MSGGKETPRQKMIGMMYLVLTALLALNVSKSILDAFVAIEENIQISNENEFGRGEEKRADLKAVAEDKSAPDVAKKAVKLMETVNAIDKMAGEQIKLIDEMKFEILNTCGEKMGTFEKPIINPESIVHVAYDKKYPLKPTRMKLDHVDAKDKYDEPMLVMGIAEDIKKPAGNGIKLWDSYNKFRKDLVELLAKSASTPEKTYKLTMPAINTFKDFKDLNAQIDKALKDKVAPDDMEAIKKIYQGLTKQEKSEVHEVKDVHWIGKTFDHSPSVAAIASLSSMQKEILTARADAVSLIRSRVGGGEYSFNKIMPLAYGPDIANNGEEITLEVLMAAYDSDKQPIVKPNQGSLKETKDGKGYVVTKASGSAEMKLTGTITILNKSGVPKTMPYEKTVKIMKPEGTISLPEMAVLYRNYDNIVVGVASGYPECKLNGNGVSLTKKGAQYVAKPTGTGKKCSISISGYNPITKKTVQLGNYEYDIKPMPKAEAFWGPNESGKRATQKGANVLFAKFGPGIPLKATFTVQRWRLGIPAIGKEESGNGNKLSPMAMQYLQGAKAGATAYFTVWYSGPGVNMVPVEASYTL